MSLQLIGYIVFIAIVAYVTFWVGWVFYRNGEVYLKMMLPNEEHLVQSINKLLLVGYYLLNLGYAAVSIVRWESIFTLPDVFNEVAMHAGQIILALGLMHYLNMFWILLYARYKNKQGTIRKAFSRE